MRSMSSRIKNNRIDIYVSAAGRDANSGVLFNYPKTPTFPQVAATTQAQGFSEVIDNDRITMVVEWKIMIDDFVVISPRDMIKFMDPQGISHTVFAEASRDEAGRGSAQTIRATEKL